MAYTSYYNYKSFPMKKHPYRTVYTGPKSMIQHPDDYLSEKKRTQKALDLFELYLEFIQDEPEYAGVLSFLNFAQTNFECNYGFSNWARSITLSHKKQEDDEYKKYSLSEILIGYTSGIFKYRYGVRGIYGEIDL